MNVREVEDALGKDLSEIPKKEPAKKKRKKEITTLIVNNVVMSTPESIPKTSELEKPKISLKKKKKTTKKSQKQPFLPPNPPQFKPTQIITKEERMKMKQKEEEEKKLRELQQRVFEEMRIKKKPEKSPEKTEKNPQIPLESIYNPKDQKKSLLNAADDSDIDRIADAVISKLAEEIEQRRRLAW